MGLCMFSNLGPEVRCFGFRSLSLILISTSAKSLGWCNVFKVLGLAL